MNGPGGIAGTGGAQPPGQGDAEARMFAPARLLLPHHAEANLEIFRVDPGEHGSESVRLVARGAGSSGGRVVGVEIGSGRPIHGCLDAIARAALDGTASGLYFLVRTRPQLAAILRLLRSRGVGRAQVYGIDPDYYHAVVPLDGAGHRAVERYILGLKRRTGRAAAPKALLKRVLIALGLSRRLYEGFLVVISLQGLTGGHLDLQVDS